MNLVQVTYTFQPYMFITMPVHKKEVSTQLLQDCDISALHEYLYTVNTVH